MLRPLSSVRQAAINSICSYLLHFQVRSTHDLSVHLKKILQKINKDPKIFSFADTFLQRTEIFTAAVAAYARVTEYNIKVPANIDWNLFKVREKAPVSNSKISLSQNEGVGVVSVLEDKHSSKQVGEMKSSILNAGSEKSPPSGACWSPPEDKAMAPLTNYDLGEHALRDLSKVTYSYDHFVAARLINKKTSRKITAILESNDRDFSVCDSIIFGAGDTGTTLWLEKYKAQHEATHQALSEQKLPGVLMIAENFGAWKHDYTLAQTQSSLERSTAVKNPSDFLPTPFYLKNPQANARHVYQANHVCLAETQAPVVKLQMLRIEKRRNHIKWESSRHTYRCIVRLPNDTIKAIYTNNVDVCTGLGPANLAFKENVLPPDELKRLNQFDKRLGFTPIVDGNQFALTNSEEGKNNRTILIYGGGGTATACYRKCFFGTDIRTYDRPYTDENRRNNVIWVYKDFIGTGKMAANALGAAKARNEAFQGELIQVAQNKDGKLGLTFKILDSSGVPTMCEFVCDQLIYSIGQNNSDTREICREVSVDLQLNSDIEDMPLYISTPDKRINFFGATAVNLFRTAFNKKTMQWLDEQNIGGDVGAGSMPPTRAQIKRHLSLRGVKPLNINANMDTTTLISEYLLEAGVAQAVVDAFIADLLLARKDDTYGCSRAKLEQLLKTHQLDKVLDIYGHSHLAIKGTPPAAHPGLLSRLSLLSRKISSPRTVVDDMKAHAPDVYHRAFKVDIAQSADSTQRSHNITFFETVKRASSGENSFALLSHAELPPTEHKDQDKPSVAIALPAPTALKSNS